MVNQPVRVALHGRFRKFHGRSSGATPAQAGGASHLNDSRSMLIVHASDLVIAVNAVAGLAGGGLHTHGKLPTLAAVTALAVIGSLTGARVRRIVNRPGGGVLFLRQEILGGQRQVLAQRKAALQPRRHVPQRHAAAGSHHVELTDQGGLVWIREQPEE
jgi:hypothetical protein